MVVGSEKLAEAFFKWLTPLLIVIFMSASEKPMAKLTPQEKHVIEDKGTEAPFTGKYFAFWDKGTYVCKRCRAPLYRSENKFEANCGWPSFDEEIPGAVKRMPDPDGMRTEIECANCGAHLGTRLHGRALYRKGHKALRELDLDGFYS